MRVGGVAYARVENEMWGVSGDGGNRREKLEQNNRPTKAPNDVDGVCLCMRREWVSESERGSIEWVRLGSIDDDDRFYSRLIWFCCYCYFWCIVGHRFNQSRHTFVDLISVDFCFLFFFCFYITSWFVGPSFHFRSLFLNSMYAPLIYTRSMDRCTIQICNVYLDGFTRYWSMNCGAATNGKVLFVLCVCAPIGFLLLFWHSYMNSICFESACVPFVLFCFVCFRCSRLVFVYCLDVSLFWPFTLCQTANNKHKQINIQQCLDMQKI